VTFDIAFALAFPALGAAALLVGLGLGAAHLVRRGVRAVRHRRDPR
jgi:hypothetical protein